MSNKAQLSNQRLDTIINSISLTEDKLCFRVISKLKEQLKSDFNVNLQWEKKVLLGDVISILKNAFPEVSFADVRPSSFMSPDGGITYIVDKSGNRYPLLIVEVKNQGTNDSRAIAGLKPQSRGNAIERLGKNVIGFKTYMLTENIFPFVCFGDGCDFDEGSSILDRVITIAMFGELNVDHTTNVGPNGIFNRGSYYFRKDRWTFDEMYAILYSIAKRAIYYYFSKYGEEQFK